MKGQPRANGRDLAGDCTIAVCRQEFLAALRGDCPLSEEAGHFLLMHDRAWARATEKKYVDRKPEPTEDTDHVQMVAEEPAPPKAKRPPTKQTGPVDPLEILCVDGDAFIRFPRWLFHGDILSRFSKAQEGADRLFQVWLNYASMPDGRSKKISGWIMPGEETTKREARLGSDQYGRCIDLFLRGNKEHRIPKLVKRRKARVSGARGAFYFIADGLVELRRQGMQAIAQHAAEKAAKKAAHQQNALNARMHKWLKVKKGDASARKPRGVHA